MAADPGTDPMTSWLRARIAERKALAEAAGGKEWQTGCSGEHGPMSHYPGCEQVEGEDITLYNEGGHDADQAAHIAANDPRDTIARCEAEMAILGEHRVIVADPGYPEQGQSPGSARDYRVVADPPTARDIELANALWHVVHCSACRTPPPCRTVRHLMSAYRHRPGYDPSWAPPEPAPPRRKPVIPALMQSARKAGRTAVTIDAIREALGRGEHVHAVTSAGLWCVDGPPDCTAEHHTLAETERQLRSPSPATTGGEAQP